MAKMLFPDFLNRLAILPFRTPQIRFAIGDPNQLSTYSWRIWTQKEKNKDVSSIYIMCRDIFKEVKVSLHPSGKWRIGFQTEAIKRNSSLIQPNENRAWDVWESPPEQLPQTKIAFRLLFAQRDVAVTPGQRVEKKWSKVTFIEAPPKGKLTAITLFITKGDITPTHETEKSFCLASFDIGLNTFAKVIAHAEPEGIIPILVDKAKEQAIEQCGIDLKGIHKGAYWFFLGTLHDNSRYLVMTPVEDN